MLDDYSLHILAWKLCEGMWADDLTATLDRAIALTGVEHAVVRHRPCLLSDIGPCYASGSLQEYLQEGGLGHIRGRSYLPMTQGKIERCHRTMKNVLLLDNYYTLDDIRSEIVASVR